MFSIEQLFFIAHSSTAVRFLTSVAVVTTAFPPVISAMRRANPFAPPMCPESRDITFFPASSRTTTAGSSVLLFIKGAIVRTAIPQADTKTRASEAK